MPAFPRQTIAWALEETTALRRFVLKLPAFGFTAGVLVRLYRWAVYSVVMPEATLAILGTIGFGVILTCAFATAHLSHFTLRQWKKRAPLLGLFIALGEITTSAVLTLAHQERVGRSGIATMSDLTSTAIDVLLTRILLVSFYAVVLATVVVALRKSGVEGEEIPSE